MRISEFCSTYSGGTPPTSDSTNYKGGIPFIRSAEINSSSTELFLSTNGLKNSSAKLVEKGDWLIAMYGANAGATSISKINGAINQAILCLKTSYPNSFLLHSWERRVNEIKKKYLQGGQGNLSAEIIKSIELPLPPTVEEANKISVFIDLLDSRIELQRKIIKDLKCLRSSLWNETQSGAKFKTHKIGDFLVESPDERESNPDKTKILSVKLNEGGVVRNETTDTLKIGATIYYKRKAGSFIYGRQNLFHGAFGIVPKQLNNYLSSADVPAFTFKSEINPKYFSRLVSHNCKSWEKLSNGSGSKRLKEDDFLGISICVPDLNTQNKIESRFEIIDFDLDKQEECLNCLIKLKNYLLSSLLRVSY